MTSLRFATLGNSANLHQLTGRTDIPGAAAVITQYTGYDTVSPYDGPTEFHSYNGLPHGFGLGTGTVAEGWIDDAVQFWESQSGVTGI